MIAFFNVLKMEISIKVFIDNRPSYGFYISYYIGVFMVNKTTKVSLITE